jgi:CRISPR/Cas system Type II protein with McrA/HNH and RuvC-like nuclease domain
MKWIQVSDELDINPKFITSVTKKVVERPKVPKPVVNKVMSLNQAMTHQKRTTHPNNRISEKQMSESLVRKQRINDLKYLEEEREYSKVYNSYEPRVYYEVKMLCGDLHTLSNHPREYEEDL